MLVPSVALRVALCLAALTQICDSYKNSTVAPSQGVHPGSCLLPQQPEYGSYTSPVCERYSTPCEQIPGTPVAENWLLSFKCNDGYIIAGTHFEDTALLICEHGHWSDKIPVCKKMCPPLISLSVEVTCKYHGDIIDCSKFMQPGTKARGICKPSYVEVRPPIYRELVCKDNGHWSNDLFYCHPALPQKCDSLPNSRVARSHGTDGAHGSHKTVTKCLFQETTTDVVKGDSSSQHNVLPGSCILPEQPEYGSYTSPICERGYTPCKTPGTHVAENWLLSFKCNDGYVLSGTRFENTALLFCDSGNWSDEIPVCKKMCPHLISLSVEVTCKYHGDIIDCSKPMRPGTKARGDCKPLYVETHRPLYRELVCKDNGHWSYELFDCQPVCGKRNFKNAYAPLITNGTPTKHIEFPWHASIYMKNSINHWEQKCGGSLITPHIVVTAAQCVFSEKTKKVIFPTDIKVGLGKYYREWTHDEKNAEKSDVREIAIPPKYSGEATSYAQDIALLDLVHSVQITANIMPVCVDWHLEFTVTPGMMGTLAGWSGTENSTSNDVLLYAEMPYVDYTHCILDVLPVHQPYVTTDKFCAGVSEGSDAVRGDSGGGLTFVQNNLHYVYGITSTKLKGDKMFATFTNMSNKGLHAWFMVTKHRFDDAHTET